jgi:hypothetical protein
VGALAVACVPVLGGIIGLIRYRMTLSFYREIYRARQSRADLAVAGQVTRPFTSALGQRRRVRQVSHTASVRYEDEEQPFPCNFTAGQLPEPNPTADTLRDLDGGAGSA